MKNDVYAMNIANPFLRVSGLDVILLSVFLEVVRMPNSQLLTYHRIYSTSKTTYPSTTRTPFWHTNPDFTISSNFNYLHTLVVGANGQVAEPNEPLATSVDKTVRPQGIMVY